MQVIMGIITEDVQSVSLRYRMSHTGDANYSLLRYHDSEYRVMYFYQLVSCTNFVETSARLKKTSNAEKVLANFHVTFSFQSKHFDFEPPPASQCFQSSSISSWNLLAFSCCRCLHGFCNVNVFLDIVDFRSFRVYGAIAELHQKLSLSQLTHNMAIILRHILFQMTCQWNIDYYQTTVDLVFDFRSKMPSTLSGVSSIYMRVTMFQSLGNGIVDN